MKLQELLPSAKDIKQLQDVEAALLRRRTAGAITGFIAVLTAALQVVLAIADRAYFRNIVRAGWYVVTLRFADLGKLGGVGLMQPKPDETAVLLGALGRGLDPERAGVLADAA